MSLLEIPGGATIDQNNKKNPKTIEMKKKKYIYIYIYISQILKMTTIGIKILGIAPKF